MFGTINEAEDDLRETINDFVEIRVKNRRWSEGLMELCQVQNDVGSGGITNNDAI